MSNPRLFALELLNRIDADRSYVNLLLPKYQAKLATKDRGFLQELTYGAIRWRLQYDLLIDDFVSGRKLEPPVRNILRLGLHQLQRMRVDTHAAVNETVELAKQTNPRVTGLVNAVMRKAANLDYESTLASLLNGRPILTQLAYQHSVPEWIISQFAASLKVSLDDPRLQHELTALNVPPIVSLSCVDDEVRQQLLELGALPGKYSKVALAVTGELGKFLYHPAVRVQDEGSQLIALLAAGATTTGTIVDLCAGPGGKASLISDLRPENELICVEPVPSRADLVRKSLGQRKADVLVTDGTTYDPGKPVETVVVDAPCSGLGSLRRKPESRWLKSESDISDLRKLQMGLLKNAAKILAPGGNIIYSTCSPVLSETQSIVAEFLEENRDFELQDASSFLKEIAPNLEIPSNRKTVQLWTAANGTDDMFMAWMKRVG